MQYQVGDRVRVALRDPDGVDARYDGAVGEVVEIHQDDLGSLTGNPADDNLYLVDFDDEDLGSMSFREPDLTDP
jgi:hypothetical protein